MSPQGLQLSLAFNQSDTCHCRWQQIGGDSGEVRSVVPCCAAKVNWLNGHTEHNLQTCRKNYSLILNYSNQLNSKAQQNTVCRNHMLMPKCHSVSYRCTETVKLHDEALCAWGGAFGCTVTFQGLSGFIRAKINENMTSSLILGGGGLNIDGETEIKAPPPWNLWVFLFWRQSANQHI